MKTPEELAELWVKDRLGMDYVKGLQSISAKDCHGMIEAIMQEAFLVGYEAGQRELESALGLVWGFDRLIAGESLQCKTCGKLVSTLWDQECAACADKEQSQIIRDREENEAR